MRPSAVFLLSDGEFNSPREPDQHTVGMSLAQVVGIAGGDNTPIHTVAFEVPAGMHNLQLLSKRTGGESRYVMDEYQIMLANSGNSGLESQVIVKE